MNTGCDMDLIAYLGIFCMWCICCVEDRMCRAAGFGLVISISLVRRNPTDVVQLYDVRENFRITD